MPKTRSPYPAEFRRQMVDLVRAGRTPEDLAKEFEPTSHSIRHWVRVAERREVRADATVATAPSPEHEELAKLRREVKQLRLERDILSRAAAWFACEAGVVPSGSSNS